MRLDIAATSPSKEPSKAPLSAQDGNGLVNRRPEDTQAWQGKVLRNRLVPPTVQPAGEIGKLRAGAIRLAAENQRGLRTYSQASSGADLSSEDRAGVEKKRFDSFKTQTAPNSNFSQTSCIHPDTSLAAKTMEGHGRVAETPKRAAVVPGSLSDVQRAVAPKHSNVGTVQGVTLSGEAADQLVDDMRSVLLICPGIVQRMDQRMAIPESNASSAGQNNDVHRPRLTANPPSKFNGQKPREWLTQMEQYYEISGFSESMQLKDVLSFLEGPGLSHYCLARSAGKAPKTWEEFCQFIMQRFCLYTEGETMRRLMQIKWEGSLDRVIERFASVLDEGTPPPDAQLVQIFMGRLPWALLTKLDSMNYPTWTAMSEALRAATNPHDIMRQHWLTYAEPTVLKLDSESSGYIAANRRPVDRRPPQMNSSEPSKDRRDEVSCYTCGGLGHKAHTCPTATAQTKKEGAICNECGGKNHWARDCTTRQTRVLHEVQRNKKNSDWGSARNDKRYFPGLGNDQA